MSRQESEVRSQELGARARRALAIAAALATSTALLSAETVVIRNVDVYPVTAPVIKGASVVIEDGKIADISTSAKMVVPKGAKVVEGKGLRVYPGMIDSGTELGLSEVSSTRETVDTGELGEFMPQLRALSAVNPESEHFGVVRVNGITSAMTFPSSGGGGGRFGGGERQYISGQAALIHTDGWTWEDMAIERTAAIHLIFPSLGGRGGRGGFAPPDSVLGDLNPAAAAAGGFTAAKRQYDQQIAHITEFFDQARQYQKERAANAPGFKRDLKLEAMIPVLEGKVPVAVSANRPNVIHDAIAFADKQHIRIVILQPHDIAKVGAELKSKNIPVILGRVLALPDQEDDAYDGAFTAPAEAYKAGVKFAFGTFTNEFVRNMPYQAATAVAFGLPYEEALKAVTINPAQIWGHGSDLGSVEKGKIADLMVVDGDPLEIQTQVKHLFIKGKEVPLVNKQTRLYEKYMSRQ
jgi:imidazolonepropionase-like amidohydrolase